MADLNAILTAGVPTLAVIVAIIRNEAAMSSLSSRISTLETSLSTRIGNLESRFDARIETLDRDLRGRIETLDRDLREWARIVMQQNTDIARLKDKAGLDN